MTCIRLLYILNEFSETSVNWQLLNLVSGLDSTQYEVHIACSRQPEPANPSSVVRQFQAAGAILACAHPSAASVAGLIRALSCYIREREIQIVHTHILRSDLVGAAAARLAHGPILFSTKHNIGYIPGQPGWLYRSLAYWPTMVLPDQIVTVSEALQRILVQRLHMSPERVTTIHNSIDVERFYAPELRSITRADLGIATDATVITFIGRLVEGKGLSDLLNVLQTVQQTDPHIVALIVGDGPLRASLQALAEALEIQQNVIFTGHRADIPAILAATDLFVLPSESEGLPQSVMEAMAAGKAIVASHVGGVPELIERDRTGLLTPPKDRAALTSAIARLIRSPDLARKLGHQARAHAQMNFGIGRMARAYDEAYRLRLEANSKPSRLAKKVAP